MKTKALHRKEALSILRNAGGSFFSAIFVKKNGEPRHINAQFGVQHNLKGTGMAFVPSDRGLVTVWEPKAQQYRMINLNTILEANVRGERYVFYD